MKYFTDVKYDNNRLSFTMKWRDTSVPNMLKRVMQAEVPTYSLDIDSLEIKENHSIFHNQRIAHTLSMTPVKNGYDDRDYDAVSFSLNVVFDEKNVDTNDLSYEEKVVVYTDDIKSSDGRQYFMKGIPLVELRKKDKLIIEKFKLKKGIQRIHAQFQAGIIKYDIKNIDKVRTDEETEAEVVITVIPRCVNILEKKPLAYPYDTPRVFILGLETILEKIKNMRTNIDNLIIDQDSEMSTVIIEDEDHSMGYLLQCHIYNMSDFKNKRYIGYRVVHPLKRIIEIKMTHPDPKKVIGDALYELSEQFEQILKEGQSIVKKL